MGFIKVTTRELLANNIIYFRHFNNWSQEIFAEKIKSSPSYVSQIENCKRNVTSDFIDKLVLTFDIEHHELFIKRDIVNNKRIGLKK